MYLDYISEFTEKERGIIQLFVHNFNNDGIKVLDKICDESADLIVDFIKWNDNLPRPFFTPLWRFKKWVKELFSKSEDDTKEKRRKTNKQEDGDELNRCKAQQKYFSKKAGIAKKKYYRLQIMIMILALLSSFVLVLDLDKVSFQLGCPDWCFYRHFTDVPLGKIIIGLCSGLIILFTGIDKLKQHVQEWTKNRVASEGLKREMNLYLLNAGVYAISDSTAKKKLFVENYESIIAKEVSAFESNKSKIPTDMEKILDKFEEKKQKEDNDNVIKD